MLDITNARMIISLAALCVVLGGLLAAAQNNEGYVNPARVQERLDDYIVAVDRRIDNLETLRTIINEKAIENENRITKLETTLANIYQILLAIFIAIGLMAVKELLVWRGARKFQFSDDAKT